MPTLKLGDGLLDALGVEANNVLDSWFITKKEEEDVALEKIKEEYNFYAIKDAFDEGDVPAQVEFFYDGENEDLVQAVEFPSLSADNREFVTFLLSDLGQNVMNNSLSIYIESGDIFYQNFNTRENFYNFLIAQQNEETASIPKKCLIITALKGTLIVFYRNFPLTMLRNLICIQIRTQNIYFIGLMII